MGTIAVKQNVMGYLNANARARCANCSKRDERWEDRSPKDVLTLHCKSGGFMVTAWAVCNEYEGNGGVIKRLPSQATSQPTNSQGASSENL